MRATIAVVIGFAIVAPSAHAAEQLILGRVFALEDPVPQNPNRRGLGFAALDRAATLVGDPAVNGATLDVMVEGASSANQAFVVPPGAFQEPNGPGWKSRVRGARALFVYRDERGENGAVTLLRIQRAGSRLVVRAIATAQGNNDPIDLVPPNPGTAARVRVTIGGGDSYCAGFGGAAGGKITQNDAELFRISKPRTRSCP